VTRARPAAEEGASRLATLVLRVLLTLVVLNAGLWPALAHASLPGAAAVIAEESLVSSSLDRSSALAALGAPATVSDFALFAGDELGRALGQGDATSRFALGIAPDELDVDGLVLASRVRELGFHPLQGFDLIDAESLRGPPERGPKTRIGGLELSGPFLQREKGELSLGLQWACDASGCGLAEGKPLDPLGLRAPNPEDRRYRLALMSAFDSVISEFQAAGTIGGRKVRNIDAATLQRARDYSLASFDQAVQDAAETDWIVPQGGMFAGSVFGVSAFSPDGFRAPGFLATNEKSDIAWGAVEGVIKGLNGVADVAETVGLAFGGPGAVVGRRQGESRSMARPSRSSKRLEYLGRTPSKDSGTGQQVLEAMARQGRVRGTADGGLEIKAKDGSWSPIEETDMGHVEDAVSWWNREGYKYGPKTPEVRDWMKDPTNYELEPSGVNRSRGAKLTERYRPPEKGKSE